MKSNEILNDKNVQKKLMEIFEQHLSQLDDQAQTRISLYSQMTQYLASFLDKPTKIKVEFLHLNSAYNYPPGAFIVSVTIHCLCYTMSWCV